MAFWADVRAGKYATYAKWWAYLTLAGRRPHILRRHARVRVARSPGRPPLPRLRGALRSPVTLIMAITAIITVVGILSGIFSLYGGPGVRGAGRWRAGTDLLGGAGGADGGWGSAARPGSWP